MPLKARFQPLPGALIHLAFALDQLKAGDHVRGGDPDLMKFFKRAADCHFTTQQLVEFLTSDLSAD